MHNMKSPAPSACCLLSSPGELLVGLQKPSLQAEQVLQPQLTGRDPDPDLLGGCPCMSLLSMSFLCWEDPETTLTVTGVVLEALHREG